MFDPYRKWLGIPPKDQPPNHYRLLGLELFESDLDVIEGAADRQMGFVRQYQSGEHAADAARILNELATARLCLLKPATKTEYDEKLRASLVTPESVGATATTSLAAQSASTVAIPRPGATSNPAPEVFQQPLVIPTPASQPASPPQRFLAKSSVPLSLMLAAAGGGVVLCALVAFLVFGRGTQPVTSKSTESASTNLPVAKTDAEKPVIAPATPVSSEAMRPDSILWKESTLMTEPAGEPIDLLKQVEIPRDVGAGVWKQTKTALIGDRRAKVYFPAKVPEDYQLKFAVRRLEGTDGIAFGFMMAGHPGLIAFDNRNSTSSGLYVDGRDTNQNATHRPEHLFTAQQLGEIVITIHPGHCHVTYDGRTIIDWHGDPQRLSVPSTSSFMGCREQPCVINFDAKFVIESARLIPIRPEPALQHPERLDRDYDVLPLVDVERDAARGIWTADKTSLHSPSSHGQLYLPVVVPEEYTLSASLELNAEHRGEYALAIGLIDGGSWCQFVATSNSTGLDAIDGQRWNANETRLARPLFTPGAPVRVDCTVTKAGIRVEADGKPLIDWRGDLRRLSLPPEWSLADARRLFLGSDKHVIFRDVKLGPPLVELEPLPPVTIPMPDSVAPDGNLLPIIHVERDASRGDWKLNDDGLTSPASAIARLQIPVAPPKQYILSAAVERQRLGGRDLYLGLIVDGHPCAVAIDGGTRGTEAGLERLDGKRFVDSLNYTHRNYGSPLLPFGKIVHVRCYVLADTVVVTCDGREIVRWHGDPRRLSLEPQFVPPNASESDRARLWLGSHESSFLIRDLRLQPMSDDLAAELASSFAGVYPLAPQVDVPLAKTSLNEASVAISAASAAPTHPDSIPSAPVTSSAKVGEWVDLLEWAEGVDWARYGINWNGNVEGTPSRAGIALKFDPHVRFPLPAILDGDYEMEVEFTRTTGVEAVAVYFPVGLHTMRLLLGAETSTVSHVSFVDGKEFGHRRPAPVSNNQPHRVLIRVQDDGQKGAFHIDWDDVKDYIQWEGASASLVNADGSAWRTTMFRHPWIGCWNSNVLFHKVRVQMQSGTIRHDSITEADREQDLKNGIVRLVGEEPSGVKVGAAKLYVNQLDLGDQTERQWPLITRDFKPCDDFFGAHAPSRFKCSIPTGAKCFSVIAYNDASRMSKFLLLIDGKQVYDSGITGLQVIKVDIPLKSAVLELVADPAGVNTFDHTYWCFPRFHAVAADRVTDKMLDAKPGPLKFIVLKESIEGKVTYNQPIAGLRSIPIHFRDALPCDEFLFAHAPSTVTYQVPQGMTRFTAIGYNVLSHHVKYEVWADARRLYESPQVGIVPIDVKLPAGTKTIELKISDLGKIDYDHSFWCYPRLNRK